MNNWKPTPNRTTPYNNIPRTFNITPMHPRSEWAHEEDELRAQGKRFKRLPDASDSSIVSTLVQNIISPTDTSLQDTHSLDALLRLARKESGTTACWVWGYRYQYTAQHLRPIPYLPQLKLWKPSDGEPSFVDPQRFLFWHMWGAFDRSAFLYAPPDLCPVGAAFQNASRLLLPERFSLPACIHPAHCTLNDQGDRITMRSLRHQETFYKRRAYYQRKQLPAMRRKIDD